jgi:hypothetical protein
VAKLKYLGIAVISQNDIHIGTESKLKIWEVLATGNFRIFFPVMFYPRT